MTNRDNAPLIRADLISAFGLLTRLPLPSGPVTPSPRAVWAWPVVGASIGAFAAVAASVALALSMPALAEGFGECKVTGTAGSVEIPTVAEGTLTVAAILRPVMP
jgi:adenosylcobinamide-GDP ribazoletransferase